MSVHIRPHELTDASSQNNPISLQDISHCDQESQKFQNMCDIKYQREGLGGYFFRGNTVGDIYIDCLNNKAYKTV